jgi:hypothetical protein
MMPEHRNSCYCGSGTVTDIKYETIYDSFLQTFALMKVKKIYDVWKDLEKMQKMSSIRAFYLKPFRNGGQLKSRCQKFDSHKSYSRV